MAIFKLASAASASLVMLFKSARILFLRRLHALFRDFDVHAGAVGEFLAGALDHFFQFLFGALKFLLMKEAERFIVNLHLRLHARINHFYSATLRRVGWS